jgi:hypothetical protein
MGNKANDTIIVAEHVHLLLSKAGVWQAYFKVDGETYRRSTKTKNQAEATRLILNWHREAQLKAYQGTSIKMLSFKKLCDQHLERIKNQTAKWNYHKDTIKRHLLPFFSKFDDVSKINQRDLVER